MICMMVRYEIVDDRLGICVLLQRKFHSCSGPLIVPSVMKPEKFHVLCPTANKARNANPSWGCVHLIFGKIFAKNYMK